VDAEPGGDRKIATPRIVLAHDRTQQVGPVVPVGFDKARHAEHIFAVDFPRLRRRDIFRHRYDRTVAHVHVAARQIADAIVHREHVRAAHDEFAARRQRGGRLGIWRSCLGSDAHAGIAPGGNGAPLSAFLKGCKSHNGGFKAIVKSYGRASAYGWACPRNCPPVQGSDRHPPD